MKDRNTSAIKLKNRWNLGTECYETGLMWFEFSFSASVLPIFTWYIVDL
jgi:hypothetical protein